VPPAWLTEQRTLADRGLDLVLGTVEPRDDGSESARLWHAPRHVVEGHLGIHGANLGVRLAAYDHVGGFPSSTGARTSGSCTPSGMRRTCHGRAPTAPASSPPPGGRAAPAGVSPASYD